MDKLLSLSQYLAGFKQTLNALAPQWVSLKVIDLKNSGAHAYWEVAEHSASGTVLAKTKLSIWNRASSPVYKKLIAVGCVIEKGLKLKLLVRPNFHEIYGLSFIGVDVDPAYTLGEYSLALIKLRERLETEGLYSKNKSKLIPWDIFTVAVISPAGAAGLGDFQHAVDQLSSTGICAFDYFESVFQGPNCATSLTKAIVGTYGKPYDCVLIIRGGGAVSELNYLNDYDIAAAIANSPNAVITGIGHEKDTTILDEVSALSLGTPSKVAAHLRNLIVGEFTRVWQTLAAIKAESLLKLEQVKRKPSQARDAMLSSIDKVWTGVGRDKLSYTQSVSGQLAKASDASKLSKHSYSKSVEALLFHASKTLSFDQVAISMLSPASTLNRGYSLVVSESEDTLNLLTKAGVFTYDVLSRRNKTD